jgi:hypothetical protein
MKTTAADSLLHRFGRKKQQRTVSVQQSGQTLVLSCCCQTVLQVM